MSRLNPWVQQIVILTALAIIPLIYAGLLIWSVKDPTGSLDTIPAAIVNEDSPATTDDGEKLALGDDVAAELLDSDESFSWESMTANDAQRAMDDGDVRAVLQIPADFSSAAASLGDADTLHAAKSRLTITTDDASNIIVGNIAATVGEAVRATVSQQVGEAFLAQVTVGFTDIAASLGEAADGAHELSEGTTSAQSGAGELVLGLGMLTDGAYDLSDGASRLAAGTTQASDGAAQLADGLKTLDAETADLPDTARAIDKETAGLAGGVYSLADTLGGAASNVDSIISDMEGALTNAQGLDDKTQQLRAASNAVSDHTNGVASDSQALLDDWSSLSEDQRKAALQDIANDAALAHQNMDSMTDRAESLTQDTTALLGQDSANGSPTGLTALTAATRDLQSLLDDVGHGADQADNASDIMRDGADQLSAATSTLVDRADELSGAISTAASASNELSQGVSTLNDGASELNAGTTQLTSGAGDASSGAGDLQNGLAELDAGATDLATGLDDGRDQVPTYTAQEGDHLAATASDPVELAEQREHEVAGYGWGLAPYFISLALWVGAMAYFLMQPALNTRQITSSNSTCRAIIASITPAFAMAFAQSTLMVSVVRFVVGIDMANLAGVYALSFFVSLTFFFVNQVLVAALGPPGRFFGLVLIVLQLSAAGGTYPIETTPEFFQKLHAWLPLTHAVDGLRSLIAGGSLDVTGVFIPIAVWLTISLLGLITVVVVTYRKGHCDKSVDNELDSPDDKETGKQSHRPAKKTGQHVGWPVAKLRR